MKRNKNDRSERKGDYSHRGVAGKLMLNYLIKNTTSNSLLCTYLHLFEEGLKLKNERLTYFALSKIVDRFNKKNIDSYTVVVIFAQLVNKSTAEEIKAQGKIIKFAIAQLTRLSLYPDGCEIAICSLIKLREAIADSTSGYSPETEKEVTKFDDRIKSAIDRFCHGSVKDMARKTLSTPLNPFPPRTLTPVEKILKTWAVQ